MAASPSSVVLTGEADLAVVPLLERALAQAIIESGGDVVVDLRELELIDAANVMRLVTASRLLAPTGRRLLVYADPRRHRVLRLQQVRHALEFVAAERDSSTEEERRS